MVGRTRRGDTGEIGARIASAVRSWCSGTSMPSADRLADLCRACGVGADWVLGLSTTEWEEGRHEGA